MIKFILFQLFLVFSSFLQAQDYQLIPDSCTFCIWKETEGGSTLYDRYYQIDPKKDTTINGFNYIVILNSGSNIYAVRQEGNKVLAYISDSINEVLIQDFDAEVGDTITDLYAVITTLNFVKYKAVVYEKDSVLVNNGVYHHYMNLTGLYNYDDTLTFNDFSWLIQWNERGLCNVDVSSPSNTYCGGYLNNFPEYHFTISGGHHYPDRCTTDPLYTTPNGALCENCNLIPNSVFENFDTKIKLYPNPTTGKFEVEFENSDLKFIYIYVIS